MGILLKLSILCLASFLSSCQFLWDMGNRNGLKQDIRELVFNGQEVEPALNCRMVGTTRTGVCQGTLTEEKVATTVQELKLHVVTFAQKDYEFASWAEEGGCSSQASSDAKIFKSERRAPELQLKNGVAFEYLLLFFTAHNGNVCIQVSYAYG